MKNIEIVKKMVNEFSGIMSKEEMLDKYKWFNVACGIHDEEITLKCLREVVGAETCKRYDNLKRLNKK